MYRQVDPSSFNNRSIKKSVEDEYSEYDENSEILTKHTVVFTNNIVMEFILLDITKPNRYGLFIYYNGSQRGRNFRFSILPILVDKKMIVSSNRAFAGTLPEYNDLDCIPVDYDEAFTPRFNRSVWYWYVIELMNDFPKYCKDFDASQQIDQIQNTILDRLYDLNII